MKLETLRGANIARNAEWDPDNKIDAPFRAVEFAGEAGEVCNKIKKLERAARGLRGSSATIEELAEELADVIICADLLGMHYGIDLGSAIVKKFNATSKANGLTTVIAYPDVLLSAPKGHHWVESKLGHGLSQCVDCKITDAEARAIGQYNCESLK